MPNELPDIKRWSKGPAGFLPLANQQLNAIERRIDQQPKPPQQNRRGFRGEPFLARITGNTSLATNRWKYAWTEVQLDGDATTDKTNGRSGTTSTDYAINLAEVNHDATYAWGVDVTGDDYPDGFAPMPIGGAGDGSHAYDVVVWMRALRDVNGDPKFVFEMMGSHDGTCDE